MKKLLTLFIFCISLFTVSQNIDRENVSGKIIVEGSGVEGITIYNSLSNIGAVTNEKGEFVIAVALNDLLQVRALPYQNFDVIVNKTMIESKTIQIFLIEEINKLDEVLVTKKELTGSIEIDANTVNTFNPKLNTIYFGIKESDLEDSNENDLNQIKNKTLDPQTPHLLVHGLNVVNVVDQLLIPLFRSEVKNKKEAGIPDVPPKSIKYYLGSNFLVENFNIPEYRVEEFIRYVEDETFDFDFLNYGHEIEFLELLSKKSKTFLNKEVATD